MKDRKKRISLGIAILIAGALLILGRADSRAADWCGAHKVPESKCTKCNPALIEQFKKAGDWCAAHQLPESVCPVCNPAQSSAAGQAKKSTCTHSGEGPAEHAHERPENEKK